MTRISTRHLDRLSIILNYVRQDMTFEEYIEIIKGSVAETGYDNFRPSLCIPGEQIKMDVFDTSLSQAGEEILAKEWASQFTEQAKTLFLAFRIWSTDHHSDKDCRYGGHQETGNHSQQICRTLKFCSGEARKEAADDQMAVKRPSHTAKLGSVHEFRGVLFKRELIYAWDGDRISSCHDQRSCLGAAQGSDRRGQAFTCGSTCRTE